MDVSKWLLFSTAIVASSMTILLLKHHNLSQNNLFIILSIISELILIYTYIIILNDHNMIVMYPFIKIMSILLIVFIGVFYYEEHLLIENKFGIVLGIFALLLLSKK